MTPEEIHREAHMTYYDKVVAENDRHKKVIAEIDAEFNKAIHANPIISGMDGRDPPHTIHDEAG